MVVKKDILISDIEKIEQGLDAIRPVMEIECVHDAFVRDFARRFCWSSNAIEGNTLSLEETVALVDFDEVRAGHTFTEYQEAVSLFKAITTSLVPFHHEKITEEWIKNNNSIITGETGEYRRKDVFVGNDIEIIYTPPRHELVPDFMKAFGESVNFQPDSTFDAFEKIARLHLDFERIHPFGDGNGRTGRMILNQHLINHGFLPVALMPKSDYFKAFRLYDKNGDLSKLIHELCKAEIQAIERVQMLYEKLKEEFVLVPKDKLDEEKDGCGTTCKCKACGTEIDIEDEEGLWGHLQMEHEEIFEECMDWETPDMIEEYYDVVSFDKEMDYDEEIGEVLTLEAARKDIVEYLEQQDEDYFSERGTIKERVLQDQTLIETLAVEHMRCVNRYGNEREWSCKDACDVEPGIYMDKKVSLGDQIRDAEIKGQNGNGLDSSVKEDLER